VILAQLKPDSDWFGRIVLKQHWNAANPTRSERLGKRAAHNHVTSVVDLAEQTGVTFDASARIDSGARRKNGRHRRFERRCEHFLISFSGKS
jgi:hypothetical protein